MASYRVLVCIILLLAAGCTLPTNTPEEETSLISGPPVVRIASPLPNATYLEGVSVNIQASVSNAGEDIARVEILVDGTALATLQTPNAAGTPVFSITQTWLSSGIGAHEIAVTAFRADGTASTPATVTVNVVDTAATEEAAPTDTATVNEQPTSEGEQQAQPTVEQAAPTDAAPTEPLPPTNTPEPPTPSAPMARFVSGINVRSGPGTNFNPPIGQFAANTTAEILGTNLDGSWLKVRYGSGEGWVFAQLVESDGDINNLPREAGPPTPIPTIPPTATPIPATATPSVTNNLVPVEPFINPPNPSCGQDFTVGVTIRNDGSGSLSTGTTRIQIIRVADGSVIRSSEGALVPVTLQSGGTHRVTFTFNIDVFVGETHRVQFIADANNEVPETIETDNTLSVDYPMPANCP